MDKNKAPYEFLSAYLLNKFEKMSFLKTWIDGEKEKKRNNSRYNPKVNTLSFPVKNKYDLDLVISFPGYKTKIENNKVTYDYRVSLNNVAISHANIIVDLFNKATQLKEKASILNHYLFDLARNGYNYNREKYLILDEIIINPPSDILINKVQSIHYDIGKKFGIQGNRNWNYTLDELSYVIMFIVLQEDINYPPPTYLGRKMPFSRYLEAVYLAQYPNNGVFTLSDVLKRTLVHNERPKPYKLKGLTYFT
jgi:hypothetical protein